MKYVALDNNKYDTFIVLLLASTIFGDIGGAFQVVRVLSILLLPYVINLKWKNNVYLKRVVHFFVFWYLYAFVSILWSPDTAEGFKELIYYPVHMLSFVELCVFSKEAINPIKSICKGWLWFSILTSIVGIWEITTDQHLSMSALGDNAVLFDDGQFVIHHYASVTFRNYNNYVVRLVSSIPFIICLLYDDNTKIRYISFGTLGAIVYIMAMNASRGGIICLAISLFYFLYYSRNNKRNGLGLYLSVLFAIVLIFMNWEILSHNIMIRTQSSGMLEDDSRLDLIYDGIKVVFDNYYGFGAGIGGGFKAMESYRNNGLSATHNLFLEIFLYFGLFVTILTVIALYKLYKKGLKVSYKNRRMVIVITLMIMLPFAVIDSGYLLSPQTWLYFASIFVFAYYDVFDVIYNSTLKYKQK